MKTKVSILLLFALALSLVFSFSSFALGTNCIDDTGVLKSSLQNTIFKS